MVTGNLWRQRGNLTVSVALATLLSVAGSAFVELALHDGQGLGSPSVETQADAPVTNSRDDAYLRADMADGSEAITADAGPGPTTDSPTEDSSNGAAGAVATKDEPRNPAETKTASTPADKPLAAPTSPSTDRAVTPEEDELELEDPIEDFDDLGDPDFDAVASAAPETDNSQRRRAEEQRRAAEEERLEREAQRSAAQQRRLKEAAAKEKAAKEKAAKEKAAKEKAAGDSKMTTLPLTVVDTMIRSNMSVKRCFFNEKQSSGEMPRRVNVKFTVLNSGRVSSARVTTEQYKGGTLDGCLGRAFKAIQFPPFQGEAKSMTYPFVL